jgi:mono/diheme cytochrome c family protein
MAKRGWSRPRRIALAGALALVALTFAARDRLRPGPKITRVQAPLTHLKQVPVPADLQGGEALFNQKCAACHGERALGTAGGPPLVHVFYEPGHHADVAFYFAAQRGVKQHHWAFGDMPPVPGITDAQIAQVVAYVRWLQREGGIYE